MGRHSPAPAPSAAASAAAAAAASSASTPPPRGGRAPRDADADSPSAAELRGLLEDGDGGAAPGGGRELSYLQAVNFAGGLLLPLRLPSAHAIHKRPSAAYLEAGTLLGEEAGRLLKLAGPLFIEGITNIGAQLVATTTVSRLGAGPLALSALVLAQTQLNFGYSIVCGIAAAMETCAGQAFGARHYALLGLILQCAMALCLLFAVPTAALWASGAMAPLLVRLGQLPDVAAAAGSLLQLMWPVLPLLVVSETTGQYLLAQGVAAPASVAGLTSLACAVPAYWWLVGRLGWLRGAPAAQVSLQAIAAVVVVAWRSARDARVARTEPHRATWRGWSFEALRGLPTYARYAVPAAAMLCAEWWIWEAVVFLAGLLPSRAEVQLGALGFVMQVSIATWTLSYSIGTGAATRIANALGAGHASNARRIFVLACCLLAVANSAVAATLWCLRHRLSAALTPDPEIGAEVRRILPAAILGVVGDGQVAVLGGLLRAAGRQSTGALIHFCTYWLFGLPAGVLLGFVFEWGALGLWMGVASATALQAVALHAWVALGLDWQREVRRSAATVGALLGSTGATPTPAAAPARSFAIAGLEEDGLTEEEEDGDEEGGGGGAGAGAGSALTSPAGAGGGSGLTSPLLGGRG
ncbi:hypothetical protein Rsub_12125 [Raphidocelis subcapitata]|uniref:Protein DETOXIFICATION n=1 Tax=Raphidocelis subcapitata TaxID=307507 RepID=A0A2V0PH17_9CHLO|nr:hypothetical protein Rsub_12125 [Raphidocelis subcapitata]|eukprot:GBF99158.1 hypothetical protein Rsub_12125 [Raphidocelis subcapitata]